MKASPIPYDVLSCNAGSFVPFDEIEGKPGHHFLGENQLNASNWHRKKSSQWWQTADFQSRW